MGGKEETREEYSRKKVLARCGHRQEGTWWRGQNGQCGQSGVCVYVCVRVCVCVSYFWRMPTEKCPRWGERSVKRKNPVNSCRYIKDFVLKLINYVKPSNGFKLKANHTSDTIFFSEKHFPPTCYLKIFNTHLVLETHKYGSVFTILWSPCRQELCLFIFT